MSYFGWPEYVPVAERRRRAEKELAKLKKQGRSMAPVAIEGRTIARSFWGESWCSNLERYSDYESRLPRGRSYVRNGFVVDLQIAKGEVAALVCGSEVYKIKIAISPVAGKRWKAICRDCAGSIDSVVELLQGRLDKAVMDRVCRQGDGLFPAPSEIKLSCSCPDWADMCKHVAAVLYGIGARLDQNPRLLFVLRGVDEGELLARAGEDLTLAKSAPAAGNVLDEGDVAALFGLDMAESAVSEPSAPADPEPSRRKVKKPRGKRSSTTFVAPGSARARAGQNKTGKARNAEAPRGKKLPAKGKTHSTPRSPR